MLARFDAREPVAGWSVLRSLAWITAPDSWAVTKDVADVESVAAHIESALAARLGSAAPEAGPRLPAMDQVRNRNNALARRLAAELVTIVRAVGQPLPAALAADDPAAAVAGELDACGVLDFRELADDDVVAWLAAIGQWPAGMPATADPGAHHLSRAALDRQRDAEDRARAQRARRHRVISMTGRDFDVEGEDYSELIGALERAYTAGSHKVQGHDRFVVPRAPGRAGRAGRSGGRVGASDGALSAAQRTAIGFVGEWMAYRWLCDHYPQTSEASWVSGNRSNVFPGPPGDDRLGFDFRVGSGKLPLMFEVKATQREGGHIELGESEVRAAERYSGNDRWRILVVTNVLDPAQARVTMLPNPFSARGRGAYREDGGALRFSYLL